MVLDYPPGLAFMEEQEDSELGKYPKLAEIVRQLMGDMSSRVAARKTGVNHNTISNMKKGDRASMESTIQFANGFKFDPNILLEVSSYPLLKAPGQDERPDVIPRLRTQIDEIERLPEHEQEDLSERIEAVFRQMRRGATGFNEDRFPPDQKKDDAQKVRELTPEEIKRRYAKEG